MKHKKIIFLFLLLLSGSYFLSCQSKDVKEGVSICAEEDKKMLMFTVEMSTKGDLLINSETGADTIRRVAPSKWENDRTAISIQNDSVVVESTLSRVILVPGETNPWISIEKYDPRPATVFFHSRERHFGFVDWGDVGVYPDKDSGEVVVRIEACKVEAMRLAGIALAFDYWKYG